MDLLHIAGLEGEIPDNPVPEGLGENDMIEIFRNTVLLRTFDERAVALQRQGRIGTYPPFWGEEG
ncbi:MAG: pyruvate dehydrogenase (acetyl-transferring) E1 component subunit alpha, partial [Actinobacteria bacterium]|nr:pyruvate dehydrogenase (acetyl-transferring) E1 component subunit alpha [Actinomycetota bacterium]